MSTRARMLALEFYCTFSSVTQGPLTTNTSSLDLPTMVPLACLLKHGQVILVQLSCMCFFHTYTTTYSLAI
jgi:hypothetical protein